MSATNSYDGTCEQVRAIGLPTLGMGGYTEGGGPYKLTPERVGRWRTAGGHSRQKAWGSRNGAVSVSFGIRPGWPSATLAQDVLEERRRLQSAVGIWFQESLRLLEATEGFSAAMWPDQMHA